MDYSISLNGIFAASRSLEQAARRVATPGPETDFAAEVLAANQAKTVGEANLQVLSTERELDDAILDIFA